MGGEIGKFVFFFHFINFLLTYFVIRLLWIYGYLVDDVSENYKIFGKELFEQGGLFHKKSH